MYNLQISKNSNCSIGVTVWYLRYQTLLNFSKSNNKRWPTAYFTIKNSQ